MAQAIDVQVPDIGDFTDVPVIEILVNVGDRVALEDPLVTLESDKATMDVPAPSAGVVTEITVSLGDTVSEGATIVRLRPDGEAQAADSNHSSPSTAGGPSAATRETDPIAPAPGAPADAPQSASQPIEVTVPDIGDFDHVPVIELLVTAGARVNKEDPLLTLESDKATMDIPAPLDGTLTEFRVAIGDSVSEGDVIALIAPRASTASAPAPADEDAAPPPEPAPEQTHASPSTSGDESIGEELGQRFGASSPDPRAPLHRPSPTAELTGAPSQAPSHATPAVRRFARELGVEVSHVTGTGRKGRVTQDDVKRFVKESLSAPATASPSAGGSTIEPIPSVDFAKFGEIETRSLSRIKRISGRHLQRAWLNVPHVTHHDEADITELEAFRRSLKDEAQNRGVRVTLLAFMMKAVAAALAEFPTFNASLAADGESLVLKKYFHIGIAVDTPNGLVVPVFRDVDKTGIFDLAARMAEVSVRAREGKLRPDEMQGGCISISSLGGIGGTAFTPIVNAPEVAILGAARSRMQPVWDGEAFAPRLMQPLDLSYDHRVIDGAEAARFVSHLAALLSDVRRLLL